MIRGTSKNIILTPPGTGTYKDLDDAENFIPLSLELRNGFLTDVGNWHKRPGYAEWRDVGVDKAMHALIPEDDGYGITTDGAIYSLLSTPSELTGQALNGTYRPTWTNQAGTIAICDGGSPVKIASGVASALGGSPDDFRFIDRLGPYAIGCGHADTEWKISASNNIENWTTGDSATFNVKKEGDRDKIKNMGVLKEKVYFFKGQSIEHWYNRGGSTPFVRIDFIETGIGADYSLIPSEDTFAWLADDLRFRKLVGNRAEVISSPFEDYIQSIPDPSSIYGFDFAKEHLWKWVSPTDGKILVYDYKHNVWSDDNHWEHGQWERIPIASYMELNNKQYIGSYNLDGLVHEWSKEYKDDDGTVIRVFRDFRVKPFATENRARFNELKFRVKKGVATSSVTTPVFSYRYTLDNSPYWADWKDVSMGTINDHNPYIIENGLGVGREIRVQVAESDSIDFLLMGANLKARELGR